MAKSDYTTGPWHLDGVEIRTASNEYIGRTAFDAAYANGRLCAAAPELLEACEQAEFWLSDEDAYGVNTKPNEILRVLRAAIAKAVQS